MNTETVSQLGEQARTGISEITGKVKDLSTTFKERGQNIYRNAERGARKAKIAAEEGIEEARRRIKSHPLTAVVAIASGAFIVGGLVGFVVAKTARR